MNWLLSEIKCTCFSTVVGKPRAFRSAMIYEKKKSYLQTEVRRVNERTSVDWEMSDMICCIGTLFVTHLVLFAWYLDVRIPPWLRKRLLIQLRSILWFDGEYLTTAIVPCWTGRRWNHQSVISVWINLGTVCPHSYWVIVGSRLEPPICLL